MQFQWDTSHSLLCVQSLEHVERVNLQFHAGIDISSDIIRSPQLRTSLIKTTISEIHFLLLQLFMEAKGVKTLRIKTNSRGVRGADFNEDTLLFSMQSPSS